MERNDEDKARFESPSVSRESAGPVGGFEVVDQQLVCVVLDLLDREQISLRGDADTDRQVTNVGTLGRWE